jgi:predicted helicase
LPRLPFAPDFWSFAEAGRVLAGMHVHYEAQPEYPLDWIENRDARMDFRVERMKLARDRRSIRYNDFLTLGGIPETVYDYKLGNRSALEWILDRYQVSVDKRSGIANDPNGYSDDPQYIVKLIAKIVRLSVETVQIVETLSALAIEA